MKFAPVLALGLALTGYMATSLAGDSEHDRGHSKNRDNKTTTLFRLMGKNTVWTPVKSVAVNWQTFHTQGLVKIGDTFYVSAVEVLEGTVRNGASTDSLYDFTLDRSTGNGRGWLFKFNEAGELLGKVELTDGSKYHPGGIDFDGKFLWVPVAEYRPNSNSNIFRVDPKTLKAEKIFSEADHIGGIVHNTHDDTLHGVSWGSRRLYTWELSRRGRDTKVRSSDWVPNPQFYIDYQDCHYQGVAYMLCGGVQTYSSPKGNVALGGLELLDLRRNRLEHQVPVNLFIDEGAGPTGTLALTHNAFWLEPLGNGSMRGYFMTETDNQAELVIYDATPWGSSD
ncbi:DUF6454 family protein [Peristeroidobacter soli]|uniref:DUF6454 family protein n=1 Tax=Peristeroidobacter soli TaxID=2497877 RepID=UPI00101CAF2C|nr:DUF6454 family protein [Peristeroidobacter soli]